ncbi:MAG: radical SAM protein, partial [Polyangiales bacterium]
MSGGKRGKQRLSARQQIRERLAAEVGTLIKDAPYPVALAYPSPYHVGMSSLGMQTIYRELNQHEGVCAHRAFLPDDVATALAERQPWITYEAMRPVAHYPLVAFSVAYELELAGVIQCLQLAGIAPLAAERDVRDPFVLGGGPLTFSNPLPLAPFV